LLRKSLILRDKELRAKLEHNARKSIRIFEWNRLARVEVKVYRELIKDNAKMVR
jgi:glycosyltransferase involved in cell wall biosynthesis